MGVYQHLQLATTYQTFLSPFTLIQPFKSTLKMIKVVLLIALTIQCVSSACPEGWEPFRDYCFAFGAEPQPWITAATICQLFKARLVQIDKQYVHDWLVPQLNKRGFSDIWTGGTKRFDKSIWRWVGTLEPISGFLNWRKGEPNDFKNRENCIHALKTSNYEWNDISCDRPMQYVCEKKHQKTITA